MYFNMKDLFYYTIGRKYKKPINTNQNNVQLISDHNKILLFKTLEKQNEYFDIYDKANTNTNIEYVRLKIDSKKINLSLCKIIE